VTEVNVRLPLAATWAKVRPGRVFRSRTVTGANLIQMLMVAGIFGMFFLGALYLQQVLHYDPIQVGLAFLPVALGIAVMSLGFSAKLIERLGARATLTPGLVLIGVGLLLFRGASTHASYVHNLLPAMVPLGIGAGLAFPALMTLAMSTATAEDSGLIGAVLVRVGIVLAGVVLKSESATSAETAETETELEEELALQPGG
jgi:MFS family permease